MYQKVSCKQCGILILSTTVVKTGGLCTSCYKEIAKPTEVKTPQPSIFSIAKEGSSPVSATSQDAAAPIMNSHSETNDYGTSIGVATLVSFLGWIAVIAGAGITIWLVKEAGMTLFALSGIAVSLVGLLLVIGGQVSRAVMDNANYSKAMLEIMKKNA